ncbi:MAG: hypothetical protein ABIK12_15350 [Pseudomonadota bacterium]
MNFDFDGDLLKKIRRWTEGPLPEDFWVEADRLSDKLDAAIAPIIVEPDSYKVFAFVIGIELCGQNTLFKLHPKGLQHCNYGKQSCTIRVLGGPLPNGVVFLGPWGPGHEAGHNIGYLGGGLSDVDHLCEGLDQEELWREAYEAGGRADAEARSHLKDPDYHEVRLLSLVVHLCGPERLPTVAAKLAEDSTPQVTPYITPLLGGPLPNGRLYLSQGALSQELVRWVCGVANPCVGL